MSDNLQILEQKYKEFYSEFYNINRPSFEASAKVVQSIAEHISDRNCKILKYRCASGYNLKYLGREGFNNIYGTDETAQFIEEATRKRGHIPFQHLNLAEASIPDVPNEKYDVIFVEEFCSKAKPSMKR